MIRRYRDFIKNMPVKEQACFSQREIWNEVAHNNRHMRAVLDEFTQDDGLVVISRDDLFRLGNGGPAAQFVYAVYIWGYPGGGYDTHRENFFSRADETAQHLRRLDSSTSERDWRSWCENLPRNMGLGCTTLTKLLYFLGVKIDGSRALILDSRVTQALRKEWFLDYPELASINVNDPMRKYIEYIHAMSRTAGELHVRPDQLEMFLFTFGNSLKVEDGRQPMR